MCAIKVYDNEKKEGKWHYLGSGSRDGMRYFYTDAQAEEERIECAKGYAPLNETEIVEVSSD